MNGFQNHIHLLIDLHPTVALATLVQKIKQGSSQWAKESGLFPMFEGWSKEYYAASVSFEAKDAVIEYIKSQENHHSRCDFEMEMAKLCANIGMQMHANDFEGNIATDLEIEK